MHWSLLKEMVFNELNEELKILAVRQAGICGRLLGQVHGRAAQNGEECVNQFIEDISLSKDQCIGVGVMQLFEGLLRTREVRCRKVCQRLPTFMAAPRR